MSEQQLLIVDSQVHIWESGTPVSIHRQVSHYTQDELLRDMDAAGVTRALLHPPSWDARANEIAIEAARQHPDRLAIVGFFDVSKPENRSLVDTWKQQPGMLGLRFAFLKPGEENWLVDGTADWLWPAAERVGLPVGLLVPNRCKAVAGIAAKHPGLRLFVDHMARPRHSKDDAGFADIGELLALAKYPNVAVKASGAPSYSSDPYPYRNIHKYLRQIFDAFGPARMFWGTDITRMPCSWRQCITLFTEELPWLKGTDLELVMGRGLCDWIGWTLPSMSDISWEGIMDKTLQTETDDRLSTTRRSFLAQVATTGAVAGAAAALPALAQEKPERPWSTLGSDQVTVAETLARYAIDLKYDDLPPEVVRVTKRTILDTLGCAIGGYQAGPSQIAIKLASAVSAKQGATVLCSGIKTSPDLAVFANGVMIRYLDFNDGYISLGSGHPSDTIGALLTPAELAGRSGRDLITATVLTYEVFCKIVDVLDTRGIGLDHSTIIGLAAVVGAGRLMGLTQQQLVHAIGITVGGNTAINQGRVGTLSNWKSYAAGEACRKAIFSVQLAQAGMTGPNQVFEGRDGFFNVISRKPFRLPKLGGGGEPYGIMHAFTKRFALGQYSQTVAQAAVEARQFFKDPGEVQEINIRVSRSAIRVMADSPDKWRPQTHETADHSMPYSAGVALMYGTIDDSYYEDPYLHDPRLLELVSRVKCIPSEEADRHEKEFNLCDLEIVLKSGQRRTVRVDYHRGHWKNPMTDAEMEEKFRLLARKHLPADRVDNLLRQLWALENVQKAGALIEMTRV